MSQEVMNTLVDMSQEIIKLKDQKWELLGALKNLESAFMSHTQWYGEPPIEIINARAAIAKAEVLK